MKSFIRLGLLNHDNGHVFCLTLAKRCDDFTAKAVRQKGVKSLINQSVGVSPTNSEKVPLEVEDRREIEVEDRSKKKNKETVVSESVCQLKSIKEDGFIYWYKAYPKKVAKPDAEKAFKAATKKMKKDEFMEFVDFISSDSMKRYKETDKQFIPAPAKYIRQELYNDE